MSCPLCMSSLHMDDLRSGAAACHPLPFPSPLLIRKPCWRYCCAHSLPFLCMLRLNIHACNAQAGLACLGHVLSCIGLAGTSSVASCVVAAPLKVERQAILSPTGGLRPWSSARPSLESSLITIHMSMTCPLSLEVGCCSFPWHRACGWRLPAESQLCCLQGLP